MLSTGSPPPPPQQKNKPVQEQANVLHLQLELQISVEGVKAFFIKNSQDICSERYTVVILQWIIQLFYHEWHVCDYSGTKNKDMGLLQSGEKTKVGQMSHSLLGSQQVDAYMFGTQKKQAHRPEQRGPGGSAVEWEALFCHG